VLLDQRRRLLLLSADFRYMQFRGDEDLDVSADPELKKVPLSPASVSCLTIALAKAARETFRGALMTMCYWRPVKFRITGCQECR